MKLKYYLRGLGLGILVTALILGIAGGNGQATLSDEEIRARAEELGMIDGSKLTLSQVQQIPEVTEVPEEAKSETEESENAQEETAQEETKESGGTESEAEVSKEEVPPESSESTSEPASEPVTESASEEMSETQTEIVTFVIKSGASSDTVSRNLVAAGLVENAKEFDAYLCNSGYSRSLRVGTYEIPMGSTWEEIAKIITGKR